MHAYLFVGGEPEIREKKMLEYAKKNKAKLYEFSLQKIADVRNLSDFTKFSQSTEISISVKDIDTATNETLNAFLKNLEEPGKNISYFLSCSNEQALLPTIVSRCQIIRLGRNPTKANPDIIIEFLKMSVGQKLKSFESYKKKDEAKKYLRELILSAHAIMLYKKDNSQKEANLIKTAQRVIYNLNLNANVSLQMTDFAVNSGKN
jgi:hypothetical protein